MSIESRRKLSVSHKGKLVGEKNPAKRADVRLKISKALSDKPKTQKHRIELSKAQIKSQAGRNGNAFKANAGYRAIHEWIERKYGQPHYCEECGRTDLEHRQYHWANVSDNYQRIIADWRRLCAKCHKAYDRVKSELKFE